MSAAQKKLPSSKVEDDTWDDIFESLTIENEPPIEYIRNVIIYTKDGTYVKVSAKHFAEIIEHEKHLGPEHSEIKSCRMNINFPKLRADVDAWTGMLLDRLNGHDTVAPTKPRAVRRRKAPTKPAAVPTAAKKTAATNAHTAAKKTAATKTKKPAAPKSKSKR